MTDYCHSRESGNLELKGLQIFHKATPVENSLIPLDIVQSQLSALEKIFPPSKKRKRVQKHHIVIPAKLRIEKA